MSEPEPQSQPQSPETSQPISALELPKTIAGLRTIYKSEWEMAEGIVHSYRRSVLIRQEDFDPKAFQIYGELGNIDIAPVSGSYQVDISHHSHLLPEKLKYVGFDGNRYVRITPKDYSNYSVRMKRAELLFDNLGNSPVFIETEIIHKDKDGKTIEQENGVVLLR
jgi:hypothetical protein